MDLPGPRLPLARYEQVRTIDIDLTREAVGRSFCDHRLTPVPGTGQVDARFHAVRTGDIGLHYLDYGAEVRIAPGELGSFYLVQIPLAGSAEITCGSERVVSDPTVASVPAPDRQLTMHWGAGNPQLIVWIERACLEEQLHKMLGRPLAEPIRFDLGMRLDAPEIRSWRRIVDLLLDEVDGCGLIPQQPLAMRELERLLLSQLLLGQPNNYSGALHRPPQDAAPKSIRRAMELIEGHAAEPLTVDDIAEATGVSVRALQEGFHRYLDTTPLNHLREVRLRHVHEELTNADPTGATVTDVAARWGFLHPGRFSVQYRKRFGQTPSSTLRN